MIEWKEIRNGCSFISGFAFKGADFNVDNDGVPILKIKNIQNDFVSLESSQFISNEKLEKNYNSINKFEIRNNEILIAMTGAGSVGRVGLTNFDGVALLNQRVGKFEVDEINLNKEYLYNVLTSKYFKKLLFNKGQGSGQPNLSPNDILEVTIPFPSYPEQLEIGKTLQLLIEKIIFLQQQNTTLEAIAQTIFKEWFGKYQIGDVLPDGWRVGEFGDLFHLLMGLSPKGDTYNFDEIGLPLLNGAGDYDNGLLAPKRFTSNPTRVNKIGDLVFCIRGTIGNLVFAEKQYCLGRGVAALSPKKQIDKYFNYITLSQIIDKLTKNATGSVILGLSKDDIRKAEIVIPCREKLDEFGNVVLGFFEKIKINKEQIQSLTKTREALLPKFMSGQVRVKM